MDYVQTIDDLLEIGEKLLLTKYTDNCHAAEINNMVAPNDYVDELGYSSWKTRILAFFKTHFDVSIALEYTKLFHSSGWDYENTYSTAKHAVNLLKTAKVQIQNGEIVPMKAKTPKDSKSQQGTTVPNITVSPVFNNSNTQSLTQVFSLEVVRESIRGMDISDSEVNAALEIIDELEHETLKADKKGFWRWGKEKFLPFVIDKGSDLGIQLLGAYLAAMAKI